MRLQYLWSRPGTPTPLSADPRLQATSPEGIGGVTALGGPTTGASAPRDLVLGFPGCPAGCLERIAAALSRAERHHVVARHPLELVRQLQDPELGEVELVLACTCLAPSMLGALQTLVREELPERDTPLVLVLSCGADEEALVDAIRAASSPPAHSSGGTFSR